MSQTGLYELHITVNIADAEAATHVAETLRWKVSQIHGDPVLGRKPFFYLTRYADLLSEARDQLDKAVKQLRQEGIFVIREKIELIVHDQRYA